MDFNLFSKDVTVTEAMKDYINKKVSKVSRVINEDKLISMDVRIGKERAFYRIELTAHLPGVLVRVEEKGSDFYGTVDTVSDAFERRLRRYKDRTVLKYRATAKELNESIREDEFEEEEGKAITRRKRFTVKPMTMDEAVLQMDMLGHSFFVFKNISTSEVNVLYLRRNGSIGLIEMIE